MALVVKDRVKETTTTTGTGTITLAGAVDGFQSFSAALADGDTTYYAISETSTGEWEVGLGTFTATGTTLARTTVLASSNAGSAVSLTAEADVFITQPASKSVFFDGSGDLTLNQDPTSALHAATKEYVDTIAAAGLHYHDPVRVEQEGNLSATYDNGTAGVGATLTNNSTQAALSIDGVTLSLNDRVLIYEQTNAYENGVYTVTDTGSASTNWVLTRSTDTDSYAPSDPDSLGQGDAFFVLEGTAGAGELYVMNTEGTITFGTTGITFTQVAATAVFTAGDGLTLTGTTFAVGAGTGVTVNANDIAIGQAVGTSDSPTFAGMTTTADITFGSNDKASFGTTLDIYSDGTDSYVVEGGTGNLYIDSADLSIRNAAGTATMASFDDTGSVTLNHNNSTKLTTQSYGIDVTGNVQSDGLIVVDGNNTIDSSDANSYPRITTNNSNAQLGLFRSGTSAGGGYLGANADASLLVLDSSFTERVRVDSSGNVGIGTSSPSRNLTLNSSGTTTLQITNDTVGTTTTDGFQIKQYTSGAVQLWGYENSYMAFATNNTERMRIDSSGNVGIGTTSPNQLLTLGGSTGSATIGLDFETSNVTRGSILYNAGQGELALTSGYSGYGGRIVFNANGSERMRIDSSGNVGIGATTVDTKLHLEDSGTAVVFLKTENTAGALLVGNNSAGNSFVSAQTTGKPLIFETQNTEAMRIDSSGNVGIGTSSPAHSVSLEQSNKLGWVSTVGSDKAAIEFSGVDDSLRFYNNTGTTERMRIDSSGNILAAGKAGLTDTGAGHAFAGGTNAGLVYHTRDDGLVMSLHRLTSDGSILRFVKDGTSVGSIGVNSQRPYIGSSLASTDANIKFTDVQILPCDATGANTDGTDDIGSSGARFKDLYLSGAVNAGSAVIDGHTLQDSTNRSGLLEVSSSLGTWKGFSIASTSTSHWSIMGDQDDFGLYDDVNNEWILKYNENNSTELYYNGGRKLETQSGGVLVTGTCTATSFSGDGSSLTNLPAGISGTVSSVADNTTLQIEQVQGGSYYRKYYRSGYTSVDPWLSERYWQSSTIGSEPFGIYAAYMNDPTTGSTINTFAMSYQGIDITGDLDINGDCTADLFEATSDITLKENLEVIPDSVEKLKNLTGYSYNFIKDGKKAYGVVAQEVEKVLPNAVGLTKEDTKTVDYNAIVALLVETVKEQEKRIIALEKKVGI